MPKFTADADSNVEIYYEDHGSGDPVVLIHGWPLSGRAWEAQIEPLVEAGHRVITYDRRGFGWSSQPWDGYDYDTFAADLEQLIQHLDLKNITLVGFSMGGGEVARYIGKNGTDRVSRVVLAAAVTPYLHNTDGNPEGGIDNEGIAGLVQGVESDRAAFLEVFSKNFFSANGDLQVSEPLRQYAVDIARFASARATKQCIYAFSTEDFSHDLKKFDVPTLVVHGDSDAIVPFEVSGKRAAAMINDVQTVIIDGGPHGINASHPQKFNKALLDFIGSKQTAQQSDLSGVHS